MPRVCDTLVEHLAAHFTCSEHEGLVRVRTPFVYPDGDVIDLYVQQSGAVATVTDMGETLRWLDMQTTSPKRSARQQKIVESACETVDVALENGMLMARARDDRELTDAVLRVSQAAARAADVWFTYRSRSFTSINDDVADFLDSRGIRYARDEKVAGRSGRIYAVDFRVHAGARDALVTVLSTGSRGAARSVAERAFASTFDIHVHVGDQLRLVSLFDDTRDVWSPEDIRLVEPVATIARWSAPDEFANLLVAA